MRSTTTIFAMAILLGLATLPEAEADPQRRRDRREERRAEEVEPEPAVADEAAAPAATPSELGLFIFPAGGQSPEQQAADEAECSSWAQAQASATPEAQTAAQTEEEDESGRDRRRDRRTGGAVRGAAKGAVVGEILEDDPDPGDLRREIADDYRAPNSRDELGDNVERALDDDDPSAAEVGAAVGAVAGRRQAKKSQEAAEEQAEAAAAQAEAAEASTQQDGLKRALTVCLEAKGYKVG